MKRFLRVIGQDDIPEEDLQADPDLSEYTTTSLSIFYDQIGSELERRREKSEGKIKIQWEGRWNGDLNSKKPYLALIVKAEGVRDYDYQFIKLIRSKEGAGWSGSFSGVLKEGDLLRGRVEMGYDCYYLVDRKSKNGLAVINDHEARKIIRSRFRKSNKEGEAMSDKLCAVDPSGDY